VGVMRIESMGTTSFEARPKMHESSPTKVQESSVGTQEQLKRNIKDFVQQNPEYNPSVAEKVVIDAIEKANQKLQGVYAEFEFSIHEKTKQIMVKVINSATKEVIRELPPEKVLDMVANLWELAGIVIDERR